MSTCSTNAILILKIKWKTKNYYRSNIKTITKTINFKTIIDIANNTNSLCKLFLSQRKIVNLCNVFANHSSADTKTQISDIILSGGFIGSAM